MLEHFEVFFEIMVFQVCTYPPIVGPVGRRINQETVNKIWKKFLQAGMSNYTPTNVLENCVEKDTLIDCDLWRKKQSESRD